MLELVNIDGAVHFACSVVGYQFPDRLEDNWCLLKIEVRHRGATFEKLDAALSANELPQIRDWFQSLSEDRLPRRAQLGFTEPCLRFSFLGRDDAGVRFAIELDHDLKPPFPLHQLNFEYGEDWTIIFHLRFEALAAIAGAMAGVIEQFPQRSTR